jgi:hypothetical protein
LRSSHRSAPEKLVLALLLGATLLAIPARPLLAEPPRYDTVMTTDNRETMDEKSTFGVATPKVYVIYLAADMVAGTKLKVVWYAEKCDGVEQNSKMTESETLSKAGTYWGAFSYAKPTIAGGWPTGTYRVELFMGGSLAKTLRFKVVK